MRTINHGPGGDRIDNDLNFLQPGTTPRDDATSKLSRIDTGCTTSTFFWGRWAESKWGYWWVVGAQGGAAGDAKRVWHVHNLLLTFDEKGMVQKSQRLEDDEELWRALRAHVAELPALDLSQVRSFNLTSRKVDRIALTKRGIEFERSGRKPFILRVPLSDVWRFSHKGTNEKRNRPDSSCHVFHFLGKTAHGAARKSQTNHAMGIVCRPCSLAASSNP